MHINIQFVPSRPNPDFLAEQEVVVIDVLRATSVMVHALLQGALEIIPVASVEEAFHLSRHGKELINRGFEDDLVYCAQIDTTPLVPIFRDGVIRAKWKVEGGTWNVEGVRQKAVGKKQKAESSKQEIETRNLRLENPVLHACPLQVDTTQV